MKHILREKRVIKYLVIFSLIVTSFIYVTVYHNNPKTYAACNFSSTGCGYFNGQATQCNSGAGGCDDVLPSVYNGQNVTSCGEAICATDTTGLENELTGYVNTFCNAANATDLQKWEGVGAAFIMASMVEGDSGGGQRACAAVFSDSQPCDFATDPTADISTEDCWVDAVNYYNSIGEVNFNTGSGAYTDNTLADQDATYKYDVNYFVGPGSSVPSIVFYDQTTGDPLYIIKHSCANPVGTLTPLKTYSVTISGYVQTYNGVAVSAATKAYVDSCYGPDGTVKVDSTGYFSFPVPIGDSYCVQVTNVPGGDTAQINPNDTGPPTSPQPSCNSHTTYYTGQTASTSGSGNCAHNSGYDIIITSTGTIACTDSTDPAIPTVNTSATAYIYLTDSWPSGSWVSGGLPDVTTSDIDSYLTLPNLNSDTLSYTQDSDTQFSASISAGDLSQAGSYTLTAFVWSSNNYVPDMVQCNYSFSTGVIISGYVQTYNGVAVSPATQAVIMYDQCSTLSGKEITSVDSSGYFSITIPNTTNFCIRVDNVPGVDTAFINPNDTGPPKSPQPSCTSGAITTEGYYPGQIASASGSGNCAHNSGYDIIITSTATIACTADTSPETPTVNTSATAYIYLTDSWANGSWVSGGLPDVSSSGIYASMTLPNNNVDSLSFRADSDTEFSASISAGDLSQTGSYVLTALVESNNYNYVPDMAMCSDRFTVTPPLSCPGQNTKPTIALPQGNYPAVPSGAGQGSGGESGTTTQPNVQYYQEVPGDWGIAAANDDAEYVGSGTSISWAPTGYQSSNIFTLNYTNYVSDYPYDPHTTTVTYNQRFTQTRYYSSSSPDGYTCNSGDSGGGSSSTCKHSYTGKKTGSGKHITYTCNSGDSGGGSSSTCIHSYKGTPYYDWHAGSATLATGSNTTYAGAPVLNECYARTFKLAVTDATVSFNGEEDNPTSITMSANVNATFGLSEQITAVHYPCQVMGITNTYIVSYNTPTGQVVPYPAAGASTTFTYGPNGNCSGTTVTAIPKTDSVSMPPLTFGDSICLEVDVKPTGTQMDYQGNITSNNGLTSKAKSACATPIGAQPYVRVFGGDVIVGTSSDSIASCYIGGGTAGIESFNQGGNGDLGAGTTTSALATGSIDGFASGQDVLNLLNPPPLTFANYPASQYGGDFATSAAASSSCGSFDYYAQAETSQSQGSTDYIGPCPTSGNIAAMTLGPDEQYDHYTCYSTSTINITGPITYAIPSGTAVSLLPSFEVVVKGADINIGTTVGNLAGEYVAELNPATNRGGVINDYGGGNVDICPASDYTTNSSQNTCSHDRLVIDGSFIANDIDFYRTYGTLSAAANNSTPANCSTTPQDCYDAEEFDYSPLNWLEPGYAQQPIIQAITSLPPVL